MEKNNMRRTCLHLAVIHHINPSVINEIIAASTSKQSYCLAEDVKGYTPLHYACSNLEASTECFRLLVDGNFRATRIRSHNDFTCLELLTLTYREYFGRKHRDSAEHLQQYWSKSLLLVKGVAAFSAPYFPDILHDMIHLDRCPFPLIKFALEQHPHLIEYKNSNGNLPLHAVALKPVSRRNSSNHVQIVRHLLDLHPGACQIRNGDGKYPLQLATESGKTFRNGLREILNAFPEAVASLDLSDSVLPFVFVRAAAGDLEKMHRFLSIFPNVVRL
eukprot:CAMPEP_0194126330 /NCGR_PEP_ID=MMETSP0150-20130528/59933_1 /TAXON_ID=122233 /ORGANISM="Chaetoceros debilis, Strain MM31A-1" /LENGTH=274 /DNA_ID=CAMNT_0038820185 /DNA_START=598 /DNA_END=1422 /DNA_ORIENTATION=-